MNFGILFISSEIDSGALGTDSHPSDPLSNGNCNVHHPEPPTNSDHDDIQYTISSNKLEKARKAQKAKNQKTNIQIPVSYLKMPAIEMVRASAQAAAAVEFDEVSQARSTQLTQDFQNLDGCITSTQKSKS